MNAAHDLQQQRGQLINGERLWASLMELAQLGATVKGGVCRLALTDLDRQARDIFVRWCEDAGCTVSVDAVGNIFARRPGRNPDLPPVMTGSHIDTQPTGGKFDGCFGVLAGVEVLRTLNDLNIETDAPLEVVVWTNEEGSRFPPCMMGSGVFAGKFDLDETLSKVDEQGLSVGAELQRIGYAGNRPVLGHPVGAYFEAHIEQGPVLEQANVPLGVVSGIQGVRWYQVTCHGVSAHAGTTPMTLRQDAMTLAREQLAIIEQAMGDTADDELRLTFGRWQVMPNAINTIPSSVRFTLDFRHPSAETLARFDAVIASLASEQVSIELLLNKAPVTFDAGINHTLQAAGNALDIAHMELLSGAFHDAMYLAELCPTSMLFVPSHQGISHNPAEYTDPRSLAAGARTLACALTELSQSFEGVKS